MKNILMIAYYYPPLGGAGVQRTLKFAKYLSKMGYNVNVLTVLNDETAVKDKSLNEDSSDNINIYRAKQNDSNKLINRFIVKKQSNTNILQSKQKSGGHTNIFKTLLKKTLKTVFLGIYNNINIPDDKISWKNEAVKMGLNIIKEQNIDVIYSTSGPYTSHLIAYELKRKTGIKWIADFRDQWVTNPFVKYSVIAKKINESLERKIVTLADSVVSVSEPIILDFVQRYRNLDENKFLVLTNGYDEADFIEYNLASKFNRFIIAYNGTIYGKRSPSNFLKAIESLIQSNKLNKDDLLIKFIGRIGSDAMLEISDFANKYNDTIDLIDYLPHKASIKQLESASALLLIIEDGKGSEGIYTGKIFEYIRSGRTIIGVVPNGVAKDLILKTNSGICCHPDSIDEISNAIYGAYKIWKGKMEPFEVNWNEVKKYDREEIARNFSKIIDNL